MSSPKRQPTPPNAAMAMRRRRISTPATNASQHESAIRDSRKTFRPHRLSSSTSSPSLISERSSSDSLLWSDSSSSSDSDGALTPFTDVQSESGTPSQLPDTTEINLTKTASRRATTKLLTQDLSILQDRPGDGESGAQLIQKYCCGGGCCFLNDQPPLPIPPSATPLQFPDNNAFKSLELKLANLHSDTPLSGVAALPPTTVEFEPVPKSQPRPQTKDAQNTQRHPPLFMKPHPPYDVFSAPVHHARELTKPGAEKRTIHFDLDVTDYPEEGDVDFKVGGAIGVCPPNHADAVDDIFNTLGVPMSLRDRPVVMKTSGGRWPTIWGEEEARELTTTRREVLTWCTDIQSYPPTKQLFRVLAEHATEENERKILFYLSADQGQPSFCDVRTGPHLSLSQLLHAFPSSKPPLAALLSVLNQLQPRFYSLSNDPYVSSERGGLSGRKLVEVAVTVHNSPDWRGGNRSGVGSGFLERIGNRFIEAEAAARERGLSSAAAHAEAQKLDLRVPMFRGLMANPLSAQFGGSDGPMMLIGAGVGMAPFRGFILNRLRNANCASKIWLFQGVRDSNLDELYSGELGQYESQIKKVVQSRARRRLSTVQRAHSEANLSSLAKTKDQKMMIKRWKEADPSAESKYVQDELKQQADVVWDVIRSVDGRVFVCGSSQGMGEGVEQALREVAMVKGGYTPEAAANFWDEQKAAGKYIAETW